MPAVKIAFLILLMPILTLWTLPVLGTDTTLFGLPIPIEGIPIPPLPHHDKDKNELAQQAAAEIVQEQEHVQSPTTIGPASHQDIQSLIDSIEDKDKREKLVQQLKVLIAISNPQSENFSLFTRFIQYLTEQINTSAQLIIHATTGIARLLHEVIIIGKNLKEASYLEKIMYFLRDIGLIFICAFGVEAIVRMVLRRYRPSPLKSTMLFPARVKNMALILIHGASPLIFFAVTAFTILTQLSIQATPLSLTTLPLIVNVLGARILWLAVWIFLNPDHPEYRILKCSNHTAHHLYHLALLLGGVIIIGSVLGQTSLILGMSLESYNWLYKLIGLAITTLILVSVIHYTSPITQWLRHNENQRTNIPKIMIPIIDFIANVWHYIFAFLILAIYTTWALDRVGQLIFFIQSSFVSIVVISIATWINRKISEWHYKFEKSPTTLKNDRLSPAEKTFVQSAQFLIPAAQILLYILSFIILIDVWGINISRFFYEQTVHQYLMSLFSILIILLITRLLWILLDKIIDYQVQPPATKGKNNGPSVFIKTIAPILRSLGHWLIIIIATTLILSEFGVNIIPILYGFSILGLAISFGGQNFVKDLINGVLMLVEGNLAVGDVVTIGSNTGTVEAMSLRSVKLRHETGAIQAIPFSEVDYIINKSRDYTNSIIDLAVSHTESIGRVYDVLQETADEITKDKEFGAMILEPITLKGIDQFTDTGVRIRAVIKTIPDPHDHFGHEFNRRLKMNMAKAKIHPPASHQIMYSETLESVEG